jgi:signal peptidase I
MSQDRLRATAESITSSPRPLSTDGAPSRKETTVTAAAPKPKTPSPEPKDTWREVVETVVFVVVLVLLLKSFTAEAFVIPTGSMAETLWGYQKLVTCPQCGYEFPVNCSREVEDRNHPKVTSCVCPNCLYDITFSDKFDPSCNTGDRVLVAKHLNDLNVMPLERMDVVVFKFPEEPQRDYVPMNYIKRLWGLPGETIGILNGDLYMAKDIPYERFELVSRSPAEQMGVVRIEDGQGNLGEPMTYPVAPRQTEADALITRDQLQVPLDDLKPGDHGIIARENQNGRWVVTGLQVYSDLPLRRQTHRNYPIAVNLLKKAPAEGKEPMFQILRKSPAKVLALRRIVYDNNHQAKDLLERNVAPRWAAEKDGPGLSTQNYDRKRERALKDAWVSDGKFGFQHQVGPGNEIDWLRYRHLLVERRPPFLPELKEIKDFMGYNVNEEGKNWVGDLILEFKVDIKEAQGELILELSKADDRFQARWDLSSGTCKLVQLHKNGTEELDQKQTNIKKPGSYRIRFANVDERLIVWVDGSLPFGDGVAYRPTRKTDKYTDNDLEPASVGVQGAAVHLDDLQLWRDTYYTNAQGTYTLYVQPGHYLCMGDNSPQSSDSRSWGRQDAGDQRGGLVPERLMLGRALLVYWPFWPANNRAGPIK